LSDRHQSLRDRALKLAAAGDALKRQSRLCAKFSLAFLTDRRRLPEPEQVIEALPSGTAVIYRDYDDPRRSGVAKVLADLCRRRDLIFFVGGDAKLAADSGAAGLHLPGRMLGEEVEGGGLLLTAACHSARDLDRARTIGASAAFLSPAFATASHPGAPPLGVDRFKRLAAASPIAVLALGGVDEANAFHLAGPTTAGFGAIGAFSADYSPPALVQTASSLPQQSRK
jgi:thiamine-phosphate pyrophosphorylase